MRCLWILAVKKALKKIQRLSGWNSIPRPALNNSPWPAETRPLGMKYSLENLFQALRLPVMPRCVRSSIDAAIPHIGIEEDNDVRPATGGVHIFILFGHCIRSLIRDDQQKSIRLKILQLEPELSIFIRHGLRLDGAADLDDSIDRGSLAFIRCHDPGYFRCPAALELIE
jgi:hypothetical protein